VAICGLIGAFNGFLRTKFNIPTFIITLAMMNVLYGAAALLSGGFPLTGFPSWYNTIGAGNIAGIPVPAILLIIVFIIIHIIMTYTTFGRSVYAAGGNPEAARLSGVNVKKVKILVMVAVQALAAIGGIMCSSQVMSAAHNFGKGWEMDVIASVIIGGGSCNGNFGGGNSDGWQTILGQLQGNLGGGCFSFPNNTQPGGSQQPDMPSFPDAGPITPDEEDPGQSGSISQSEYAAQCLPDIQGRSPRGIFDSDPGKHQRRYHKKDRKQQESFRDLSRHIEKRAVR